MKCVKDGYADITTVRFSNSNVFCLRLVANDEVGVILRFKPWLEVFNQAEHCTANVRSRNQ